VRETSGGVSAIESTLAGREVACARRAAHGRDFEIDPPKKRDGDFAKANDSTGLQGIFFRFRPLTLQSTLARLTADAEIGFVAKVGHFKKQNPKTP
jgi:hypothetical protein